MKKKAVILFSGGLDSSTVLALAQNQDFDCYPISFSYGQRHSIELTAAKRVADYFDIKTHKIINLPGNMFGASALTDNSINVPKYSKEYASEIPVTYVPARNTIFLSIALGYAESINSHDIFLGVSEVDYSGYPDCRPEFNADIATGNACGECDSCTYRKRGFEQAGIEDPTLYQQHH